MVTALGAHNVVEADPREWDAAIRTFPDYTVYHTSAWLDTVAAVHGVRPLRLQLHCGDRCAAVWPCFEMRKGPLRVVGSPLPGWSTAYLGPLFQSDQDLPAMIQAFLEHKRLRRPAYFACKLVSRSHDVDLSPFGFAKVLDLDTYRIDLTEPTESLWSNLKSECRSRIRKARKLDLEIIDEPDGGFIDDYWKMSVETFRKSNIQPTHNKQFVVEMWKRLNPAGSVRALSAFQDGKRIATLVLLLDDHTMYYWGGAAYTQYRDVPAHNLLHWEAIERAKACGLREYDFISTFGGPGRFKRTFGPRIIPMATHWEKSQSRLMAAIKRQYQNYLLKRRRVSA